MEALALSDCGEFALNLQSEKIEFVKRMSLAKEIGIH